MPYQPMPTFKAVPDKILEIPQPGIGGLNLKELEFEQEVNQSPYMLNMMYRNGAFGKRFGQEVHSTYEDTIYAITQFNDDLFLHVGTEIIKRDETEATTSVLSGLSEKKGLFITYAQKLYYLTSENFYVYDGSSFSGVTYYVPDVIINCKPDGSYGGDKIDDYNIIGRQFNIIYNGENNVTVYQVGPYDGIDDTPVIDWNVRPTIKVNDQVTDAFTVDKNNKTITFNTAPGAGPMNVVMTFTTLESILQDAREDALRSKYYETFGGANNSRLFLAGGGQSRYYYSEAYDCTYIPESNYAVLGNTEEDITGFGRQYNVLILFKPREIYSIYSYVENASTTVIEERFGLEAFKSQLVNARVGCDAPNTIQLINNQLTWFNSNEGICVLTSTSIIDERNVKVISRNIERTNNFGVSGILDYGEDLNTLQSADYNNKYFLVFPKSGACYMWDYEISPYYNTVNRETAPRQLDWFLFNKFYVKEFMKAGKVLLYVCSHENFENSLIKLTADFSDVNFEQETDDEGNILPKVAIKSHYMTPFLQFNAVESLKNVKNIYVQCRGDTASVIDMYYYTEESLAPERESESIRIGGRLWSKFQWSTFQWFMVNYAYTFRRKCNLKKIQMASFYFENSELDRDMSITHIGIQYQLVKYIR